MDLALRIQTSFDRQSLMATLGARLVCISSGEVSIEAPILPSVTQQQGFAHGGVPFAIGDSAAGYAALTLVPEDREVVTSEMAIHFLAPARDGVLVARGRVIKPGRRQIVVAADVFEVTRSTERQIAVLTGTMVTVST